MSKDTIYREDAIKAIEKLPNAYNGWSDAYDKAYIIGTLEEVPSADRPQGEWIKEGCAKGSEMCNRCGFVQFEGRVDNYCPYCGAKMRVKGTDYE